MMIRLFFILLSYMNAQLALPTFQAVHNIQSTLSSSSLYEFTSHTFTNCGATGKDGPTLANCKSSYDVSWENNTDYFDVPDDAGIQYWTVPTSGLYTIEAYGAEGGDGYQASSKPGGKGARMKGDFILSANDIIRIVIGQRGDSFTAGSSKGGGGGGASFVIKFPYNDIGSILVIAGGGGGNHYNSNSSPKDGSTDTSAVSNSATGTSYSGGGGGGFVNDGVNGDYGSTGGKSFLNGSVGGNKATSGGSHWSKEDGGFGGGSGGAWSAGSGGGYLGSRATTGGNSTPGGSGGGSYNSGSNQSNTGGVREGHGQVIITIN